jgi:hypothetical protein
MPPSPAPTTGWAEPVEALPAFFGAKREGKAFERLRPVGEKGCESDLLERAFRLA